ncbi:hypothetical protein C8Q79DRAFT_1090245 [Trametes meyenii]|nr:hypothetical protein C8Q79DRAFT_1090245 [Trametes meyenii]
MIDVRRTFHNDLPMGRGEPTLAYAGRTTKAGWTDSGPGYPGLTKDCWDAAVPSFSNNNGPKQSRLPSFIDQGEGRKSNGYSTFETQAVSHRPLRASISLPQQPIVSHDVRERSRAGLPQRPDHYIFPGQMSVGIPKMSQPEVCRLFLAGRCTFGDKCHRSHQANADAHVSQSGNTFTISPTVRLVGGAHADRLSRAHWMPVDQLSPPSRVERGNPENIVSGARLHTHSSAFGPQPNIPPMPRIQSHPLPLKPEPQPQLRGRPPPQPQRAQLLPSIPVPVSLLQKPGVEPENLDAERLTRIAEMDPRPHRKSDEICQLYQKGLCTFGDRCYKAHVFLLPQSCITQVLPRPKRPSTPKKIPATISWTAPDGTVSEREVCKLGAVGLCPKGAESCRYVHITQEQIDSFNTGRGNDRSSAGDSVPVIAAASQTSSAGPEELTQISHETEPSTTSVGEKGRPNDSRQVCRLYFRRRYCYKLPCRYSHDVLDLSGLPPDDELVIAHADEIREALAKQGRKTALGAPETPSPKVNEQSIVDTARKRLKKPPKPGTSGFELPSQPSSSRIPRPGSNPTERRLQEAVEQTSRKDLSSIRKPSEHSNSKHISEKSREKQKIVQATDAESSDTTYYSVETNVDPAGNTVYVAQPTSRPGQTADLPCFDFIRGRCYRPNCRYSHDVGVERMRQEFRENTRLSAPVGRSGERESRANHRRQPSPVARTAAGRPNPTQTSRDTLTPDGRQSNAVRFAPSGARGGAPALPPGLGLEGRAPKPAQPTQSRAAPESITITVLDATKVTFTSGFAITHVTTGFECRQIELGGVPAFIVPASVSAELGVFGDVMAVVAIDSAENGSATTYRVTFSSGQAAIDAVTTLDGVELFGAKISARLTEKKATALGGGTLYDGDVLFELPTPYQIGFVGYPTEELALKAIALAATSQVGYTRITAEMYQGIPAVGAYSVRFLGLPTTFTVDDIEKHFVDRLDADEKEKKRNPRHKRKGKSQGETEKEKRGLEETAEKCEGVMIQRAKYQSTHSAAQGLQRMLKDFDEDVSLNMLPPPYGKYVRVWAHFTSPDAAARACKALHRYCPRFVGKSRIFAHHIKSMRYKLPSAIFRVLAPEIDLLRSYMHDDEGSSISVIDRRASLGPAAPVTVKLVSQSMAKLTEAKVAFERLLRGEKVTENGQIVWNDFFDGKAGAEFFEELEKTFPMVLINRDPRRRTIALFGTPDLRERVRTEIIARVRLVKSQLIHRYPVPAPFVPVFMSEHLVTLRKELGHENAWFDITHKQLVVRGDEDAQKVAQLMVLDAQKRSPSHVSRRAAGCPVCFDQVSQPIILGCGHSWCKTCLTGYLISSVDNKSFPLTCLADGARCSHPISLTIAKRLLSVEDFDAVVKAAFTAYVQQRPKEFYYCPTPDCPQVYRAVVPDNKSKGKGKGKARGVPGVPSALQCPSCLVRICAHCNAEYHETVSCQDRNPEDEALFETWKTGHDVKNCPSCNVPIERLAGCNHMTCESCKIHICWACLETFKTSGEVYGHMRSIHGGIGL